MLDELEDILIQADFGVDMAETIVEALRRDRFDRDITADEVRALLADEVGRCWRRWRSRWSSIRARSRSSS